LRLYKLFEESAAFPPMRLNFL